MTGNRVQWRPDPTSARILTAFTQTGEPTDSVLRRALRLLAQADGILDPRGHVRRTPPQGRTP